MEEEKRKIVLEKKKNDIIYSKSIKAGKRIYYLDVKRSRNDDLFLAITESKKRVFGSDDNLQVSFEKHKIFLYKEDFKKFSEGLQEVIDFIVSEQGEAEPRVYLPKPEEADSEDAPQSADASNEGQDKKEEEIEEATEEKKGFFDKFKF